MSNDMLNSWLTPLLSNPLVKTAAIPIGLALSSLWLHRNAVGHGKSPQPGYNYWVWKRASSDDDIVTQEIGLSLADIRSRNEIVEVHRIPDWSPADFTGLGLRLVLGAIAVNLGVLVGSATPLLVSERGAVLAFHVFLIGPAQSFARVASQAKPASIWWPRFCALFAVVLGVGALVMAFGTT